MILGKTMAPSGGANIFPALTSSFLTFASTHARASESNAVCGFIEIERTLTPRDAPSRRFSTHDRALGTSRSRARLELKKKKRRPLRARVDQAI
jgi:hypothetical protein